MINHSRHDYIELSFVYLFAVILLLTLSRITTPVEIKSTGIISPEISKKENSVLFLSESFKNINVIAKAYVVYDVVDNKVIASKNKDEVLPLASLTKIMTAITALTYANTSTLITIDPSSVDDGYDLGLEENQIWKLGELLKYTLVFSSNDGAQAIADNLGGRGQFVNEMNSKSKSLGLNLKFTQPAGLDLNGQIGGSGSALDMAKLFAVARKTLPAILDATTKPRVTVMAGNGKISGIPNTNQEIGQINAEASKTGFTDVAGGNLGVVVDPVIGHPVVIVVLGSTISGRFADVDALYRALLQSINSK
ncbi:MAG: serine-type D-Ala-D-Ala carboxypeptidase D-alanyl-D-alanine carboxypeptidase [Candidatus Nomurabacteria bacterium]|nr:serine-type D-Ala-D-Ala carboxypeptidase D-alanyl-D-alanine carboxypeptidase [Candidatus Nomurabacteria bacterium]